MRKILIIDDEPDVALYLRTLLEDHNYETLTVHDADAGRRVALEESPDLIFLDIMMPKKSGISLYKEFKEDGALKDIPVVIISGVESAYSFKGPKFRKLIPDSRIPEPLAFFEKPVNVSALMELLTEVFESQKMGEQ